MNICIPLTLQQTVIPVSQTYLVSVTVSWRYPSPFARQGKGRNFSIPTIDINIYIFASYEIRNHNPAYYVFNQQSWLPRVLLLVAMVFFFSLLFGLQSSHMSLGTALGTQRTVTPCFSPHVTFPFSVLSG